ncbi:hypothetical protein [Clostridium hydrogenum]|uniref:hypothetical protein n=1 Tax=Clostridium hydrogenum TaxID=2855764 RepID=UPI001F297EFB|nr:hypothetical protein [Clostridium hydrogenum]
MDENIRLFANELEKCFSKEKIEEMARKSSFVKRKGKIGALKFICLCGFMDAEVANNTPDILSIKVSAKIEIIISSQALDKCLNKRCAEFLKKIF